MSRGLRLARDGRWTDAVPSRHDSSIRSRRHRRCRYCPFTAFYRELGFDLPASSDGEPHVEASLPGGLRIAWDTIETVRSFDPSWQPASGGSRMSLAFACDGPADVDATYARLTAAGHEGHLAPWDAFWGMRYAVLHDPDGNSVDLFALLPGGD